MDTTSSTPAKKNKTLIMGVGIGLAIAAIAGGAYYAFNRETPAEKVCSRLKAHQSDAAQLRIDLASAHLEGVSDGQIYKACPAASMQATIQIMIG